MFDSIVKGLEAYALGNMAKDLGSRYSNPNKVIRTTTNMIEAMNLIKSGGVAQDNALDLLKLVSAAQAQPTAPVVDQSAKDINNINKALRDQQYFNKKLMAKLDALQPTVPATTP